MFLDTKENLMRKEITRGGFLRSSNILLSPNESDAMVGCSPSDGFLSVCHPTLSWPSL